MEYPLLTVVETRAFRRKAERLLSSVEILELVLYLATRPKSGVLIKGTGGVRKLRWARGGRGKSAGVRVIYYYHSQNLPLYLLSLFGKNEQVSLSQAEKDQLAKLVHQLRKYVSQHEQ